MGNLREPDVKDAPVYKQILRLKTISPVVFYTIVVMLLMTLIVAVIVPLFMPEQDYLYLYLNKNARKSTITFLNGKGSFIVYDDVLGWRNRPNVERNQWVIDENGARTTHKVGTEPSRDRYVLFLGNSLINGSTGVSNKETISAYIEDASIETINFATMLYSFDQVYLAYKYRLGGYKAHIVVVGLPDEPTAGLLNQYIPFRSRDETNMPFFKPRFEMRLGELFLIPVLPIQAYESIFNSPEVLKKFESTDAYYSEFSRYKRFGLMPFSYGMYYIYKKISNFIQLVKGEHESLPLLKKLMSQMVLEASRRDAIVIFVALPDINTVAPNLWRRYLPDIHGRMVEDLKNDGYNVLDARTTLRQSGIPVRKLFYEDGLHYSSTGNRVIAGELKAMINHLK